ncbi:MAG: DUF4920 domain-containing protein [Saprospiraceae bacterium]|nr:DUF4920 domain-containing protein [Saprospiraceae bacterium]
MKNLSILLIALFFAACKNQAPNESAPAAMASHLAVYGDSISTDGAIGVTDALGNLKTQDSVFCTVSGYVTSVCKVKGCWMVLSENPQDSTGFFVKFKDYGFFVPLEFEGTKVVVKGKAFKEVTGVDELKHYAEDEGKSQAEIDAITQPQEEMKFMADGVVVLEEKK